MHYETCCFLEIGLGGGDWDWGDLVMEKNEYLYGAREEVAIPLKRILSVAYFKTYPSLHSVKYIFRCVFPD